MYTKRSHSDEGLRPKGKLETELNPGIKSQNRSGVKKKPFRNPCTVLEFSKCSVFDEKGLKIVPFDTTSIKRIVCLACNAEET